MGTTTGGEEHDNLVMEVARAHYFRGESQVRIAEATGLSRFQVSRLLSEAWDRGAVRVSLHRPMRRWSSMEQELKSRYGLQEVSVTSCSSTSQRAIRAVIGRQGALLLQQRLTRHDVLGIGWGRTVKCLADALRYLPACEVVQLAGQAGLPTDNLTDLVGTFAQITGRQPHAFKAPMLVASDRAADDLLASTAVKETIGWVDRVSLAVVAVGSWDPPNSQLRMMMTPPERSALERAGVVAEVCGALLDRSGQVISHPLDHRIMAAGMHHFKRIPTVMTVAGHVSKASAIEAALLSGMIEILVTDHTVARALLADRSTDPT
ncbi:MAG: hypothetical protein LBV30_00610 [Propionibacteriaceae bacterium]|jgi:DNA-binding transcriptional regulator LsrR (DeoR family)|nr:hypothetical protein [Propionibacteriaceae bacterium]